MLSVVPITVRNQWSNQHFQGTARQLLTMMFACTGEDGAVSSPQQAETTQMMQKLQAENKNLRKKTKRLMDYIQQIEADRISERSLHEKKVEELQRALDNKIYAVTSSHQGRLFISTTAFNQRSQWI